MVKKEFEKTFRTITNTGNYGLVFIAHSTTRLEQGADGNSVEILAPDIKGRCYDVVNRMVDIIGYISTEEDGERYLYTRKTPTIMAGSRFRYLAPKILLGYQELVDAISDAIDEDAKNGAVVVDKVERKPVIEEDKTAIYKETMNSIKKIAKSLNTLDANLDEPHYMSDYKKITETHLGKNKMVKDCTEEQNDFLELILSDLLEYVKNNNIEL